MIHFIKWRNFFSFAEENEVSFVVGKAMPEDYGSFIAPSGTRLSKIVAVLGANASGKTNLMKVFPFLRWLMLDSFQVGTPYGQLNFRPFRFHKELKPAMMAVEFESDRIYRYEVTFTEERILTEELFEKKGSRFSYLFKRENGDGQDTEHIRTRLGIGEKTITSILRPNATLFSTLLQTGNPGISEIAKPIRAFSTNVDRFGRLRADSTDQLIEASWYFKEHPTMLQKVSKLLKTYDLGLSDVGIQMISKEFSFDEKDPQDFPYPYASHRFRGIVETFPFEEESSGTQRLFVILQKLLSVMKTGGIAVLDEFEVDLHPLMISPLLKTFMDPDLNPRNAQLLLSTHSVEVFSELHKQQVVLVEKQPDGASECWRLDETRGVRSDENHLAKYLSGAYGAIPEIG